MSTTTCNCPRTWLRSCFSLFAEPGRIQLRDPLYFLCLLLQVFQNLKQPALEVCRHLWVATSTAGLAIGHRGRCRRSERFLLSWHNTSIHRAHVTGVYVSEWLNKKTQRRQPRRTTSQSSKGWDRQIRQRKGRDRRAADSSCRAATLCATLVWAFALGRRPRHLQLLASTHRSLSPAKISICLLIY